MVSGPTIRLGNGHKMPLIGFGSWLSKPSEVCSAVGNALTAGYRHIDTAALYENEKEIGNVIQKFLKTNNMRRDEIFVTTKLWCTHNRPEEIEGQLKQSLQNLQLNYVDLYLIHMPTCFNHDMSKPEHPDKVEHTWQGMEDVYKKGLTRAIGVSNFSIDQIERVQKTATVKIHNVQVECHLYFPQFELQKICEKHQIVLTAYAPLGLSGQKEFRLQSKDLEWGLKFNASADPIDDEVVKRLASKYHKTNAQILLRYLLQRDIIVIPRNIREERIRENFNVFDFSMTAKEMKELNEAARGHQQRLFLFDFMAGHPEDPFKTERKRK